MSGKTESAERTQLTTLHTIQSYASEDLLQGHSGYRNPCAQSLWMCCAPRWSTACPDDEFQNSPFLDLLLSVHGKSFRMLKGQTQASVTRVHWYSSTPHAAKDKAQRVPPTRQLRFVTGSKYFNSISLHDRYKFSGREKNTSILCEIRSRQLRCYDAGLSLR